MANSAHGGFDGGAVADDNTVEKDINLEITLKLGEFLESVGFYVVYTRTSDTALDKLPQGSISKRKIDDMKNRLSYMSVFQDAVFVSIHLNKFTSSNAKGAQVFYSHNSEDSRKLAESIQNSIVSQLQPENTRAVKKAGKDIYLLYNAKVPAVITECGFLSNYSELNLLKNEEYQSKIAFAVFIGILDYYSL